MKKFLVLFLLPFCVFFAKIPSGCTEAQGKKWQEMEIFVDKLIDGCGKPVDAKIKEMVIILNLFDIETSQSCEGHLRWGHPFPWVDIRARSQIQKLEKEREVILDELTVMDKEIMQLQGTIPQYDIEELNIKIARKRQENWKLAELIDQCIAAQENKLWDLLDEFYGKRDSFKEGALVIQEGCLLPLGGCWQNRYNDEKKIENLIRYQQEMDAFKEFLIQKYLDLQ